MTKSILFAVAVGVWFALAGAALADSQYCIVKVGDLGRNLLIGRSFHRIPGLPAIFITPQGARYTLSADRRLVPYVSPYPTSYLDQNPDPRSGFAFDDHWKAEPWSGRIVASAFSGPLSVLEPGDHSFRPITKREGYYSVPFILPRARETIVTRNGRAWVVGKDALEPWRPAEYLRQAGADGITAIYDAPSLGAIIAIDSAHRLWGSFDAVRWQELLGLDKHAFARVFDPPEAQAAVVVSLKSVTKISKAMRNGTAVLVAKTMASTTANGADRHFAYLPMFGEVLRYAKASIVDMLLREGGAGWQKLGINGFESIPGGSDANAAPEKVPDWTVRPLASRGVALIEGRGGLFSYDGKTIAPIARGERTAIGKYPSIYYLPAIEQTLIKTSSGLKALSGNTLLDIPAEYAETSLTVSNWPEAERAAVFSAGKVTIIDNKLMARETLDLVDSAFDSAISGGTNPVTGDLIFTGKRGTYLIVDTKRNGRGACVAHGS